MPFVHSFNSVTPPARFDAVAWSHVRIEESATAAGTFTQIDEKSIAVDPTPESPNAVNVTTSLATLASGYYRFRFRDAALNLSPYSSAVLSPGGTVDQITTIAELDRILNRGGSAADYTTESKDYAIDIASAAFEQEANVAFTSRVETFTLDGSGTTDLCLPVPRVQSVSAATVDDVALVTADVEAIEHDGSLYYADGWTLGRRNVSVTVTHGWETTPADVSRAVALIAGAILADGPWDDRGYGVTEGGGMVRLLTAGVSGAAFSIPEVQAALSRHRYVTVA